MLHFVLCLNWHYNLHSPPVISNLKSHDSEYCFHDFAIRHLLVRKVPEKIVKQSQVSAGESGETIHRFYKVKQLLFDLLGFQDSFFQDQFWIMEFKQEHSQRKSLLQETF